MIVQLNWFVDKCKTHDRATRYLRKGGIHLIYASNASSHNLDTKYRNKQRIKLWKKIDNTQCQLKLVQSLKMKKFDGCWGKLFSHNFLMWKRQCDSSFCFLVQLKKRNQILLDSSKLVWSYFDSTVSSSNFKHLPNFFWGFWMLEHR